MNDGLMSSAEAGHRHLAYAELNAAAVKDKLEPIEHDWETLAKLATMRASLAAAHFLADVRSLGIVARNDIDGEAAHRAKVAADWEREKAERDDVVDVDIVDPWLDLAQQADAMAAKAMDRGFSRGLRLMATAIDRTNYGQDVDLADLAEEIGVRHADIPPLPPMGVPTPPMAVAAARRQRMWDPDWLRSELRDLMAVAADNATEVRDVGQVHEQGMGNVWQQIHDALGRILSGTERNPL